MNTATFKVLATGVFLPGFPNTAAYLSGVPDAERALPTGELLDKRSRRRCSMLTRALADVYAEVLNGSKLNGPSVAAVFGSALGEADTMVGLLDTMWRSQEPLSPMAFAMSVHNAASGMVSISTENREFTTSLGADFDTPAMAIFEALGLAATSNEGVIVVCGDEGAPEKLVPEEFQWAFVSAGLALAPLEHPGHAIARISWPFMGKATIDWHTESATLCRNPQLGMLELVANIGRREFGTVALDRGMGTGWCVEIFPP